MTSNNPPTIKSGLLGGRRLVLLGTTILSLGAAALIIAPDAVRNGAFAQNVTQQAQTVARPTGFADIVEKVKPAVISVRVKVDRGPQLSADDGDSPFPPGSPMERFFKRFGSPQDQMPGQQGQGQRNPRGRSFSTGQGSGFFISADGFAVTNNHVVDKADSVEITTDDGTHLQRQGDRHRLAHRPGADQGRWREQFPVRQARGQPLRASATGCWRSAIRSASAAP